MDTKRRINGFEFLVERSDGSRTWERIQGAGGLVGDGTLYQFDDGSEPTAVHCAALLSRARQVVCDGARILLDPDAPPAERFATIHGVTLHACRPR